MDNYLDTVQLALEQLGPLRASDEREVEKHKARLTRRAGYLINQKNPNIGLLKKETGNQVMGMSVDLIIDRTTGDFADVATDVDDGDGFRRIAAQFIANHDAGLIPRWVCPTPSMAGLEEGPHPDPDDHTDSGGDPSDATVRFDAIDARLSSIEAALRKNTQAIEDIKKALAALEK
jgi:hypothetical protein